LVLVQFKVYDVLGKEIATLVHAEQRTGNYEVNWDAENYPSGVYFYTLQAGNPSAGSGQGFTDTKKLIVLK
jgi:hypothetical protein